MNSSQGEKKSTHPHDWAERARMMLDRRELTYDQIAPALEVSTRSAVGHYLSGRRQLSAQQAVNLAECLGCRVGWLLTGELPIEPKEGGLEGHPSREQLLDELRALPEPILLSLGPVVEALSNASFERGGRRKRK